MPERKPPLPPQTGIEKTLVEAFTVADAWSITAEKALKERDRAIRIALANGLPVRRISELTGLGVARIYQIRDHKEPKDQP